ncbi:hypothetical protein [Acinetobacter soli]|uniref:Uncharacterized protein n=1 Tax=Acinetobacter soli NIPH 2899 TaxID=1217677 RepID=A0ABP2U9I9_9GAMM|nr:hypothetical protein [Acinetobacter soli]ENV60405.1 hypothetical protein F950_02968 [Acinetobacter soli NIPH 2899]
MTVQVRVTEIDRSKKQLIVEAYKGDQKIFKSSMPYKIETRTHIETLLKKELKKFNNATWGGMSVVFLCRIEVLS